MNGSSLLFRYSARLVVREWGRFVLPFLSLTITAIVLLVTLLLSTSSTMLLDTQARELLGGDIVIESTRQLDIGTWSTLGIAPRATSTQIEFTGTLESNEKTAPFSIKAVSGQYPLYGTVTLTSGAFTTLKDGEIYLDAAGAERLSVTIGSVVSFGEADFTVAGIINTEPTALLTGFRFFPQALITEGGFTATGIDPSLLRAEYSILAKVDSVTSGQISATKALADNSDGLISARIAGENRTGLQRGVQIVADFLIIAILITAVLAAVNVYASTLYLVTIERKSLAILLTLGLTRARLTLLLANTLGYVVVAASTFGVLCGYSLFIFIRQYVFSHYQLELPLPPALWYSLLSVALLISIAIASFIPAVKRTLAPTPKQILSGGEEATPTRKVGIRSLVLTTSLALLPLGVLASLLLNSLVQGVAIIGATTVVYATIAGTFAAVLGYVYTHRRRFSFTIRSVISQKKADGLFGIISFASLFVALTALSTLSLVQIALARYLTEDLAVSVPSTYVLDIQPSQYDQFKATFPAVQLFSSIQARIKSIDDVQIQTELAKGETTVDRELGREFNLSARSNLLESEMVVAGEWGAGVAGQISVDEDFANRTNISLGSQLVFLIQGFEVVGTVTSLRSTDSRSGVPFFYIVMSEADVGKFPATYFGYANYDEAMQSTLGAYVAANTPNVSVIKTNTLAPIILAIVGTLMVLVLIVTIPPLLIATLLIVTLIVSSFSARRREGSRLRALGATRIFVLRQYLAETLSLTAAATMVAYVVSCGLAYGLSQYFFKLNTLVLFDAKLLIGLALIAVLVALVGLYLFITDRTPLREILSYGDNT